MKIGRIYQRRKYKKQIINEKKMLFTYVVVDLAFSVDFIPNDQQAQRCLFIDASNLSVRKISY